MDKSNDFYSVLISFLALMCSLFTLFFQFFYVDDSALINLDDFSVKLGSSGWNFSGKIMVANTGDTDLFISDYLLSVKFNRSDDTGYDYPYLKIGPIAFSEKDVYLAKKINFFDFSSNGLWEEGLQGKISNKVSTLSDTGKTVTKSRLENAIVEIKYRGVSGKGNLAEGEVIFTIDRDKSAELLEHLYGVGVNGSVNSPVYFKSKVKYLPTKMELN